MRPTISQLHRAVLSFGACRSAFWVSSGSPASSSSSPFLSIILLESHRRSNQALCYTCKSFSSATEKRPLLWQDYFPDSSEHWNCDMTQPLTNAEHQIMKESLEVSHDRALLHGIKVAQRSTAHKKECTENFLKQPQVSLPEVSHVCKSISGLEAADDAFNAQLPSKYKGGDMANILSTLGMLDEIKEPLSADDFICILQKCKTRKDLVLAKRMHAHICRSGLETHKAVGNHLVPLFVECGSVADAQEIFDRLVFRNVYSWTSLLVGYIQHGQLLHVIKLYEKMQAEGIPPSSYTLVALVKVCIALRDTQRGRKVYIHAVQCGFESDVIVGSTLIDMYSKSHSLAEAQKVFDKLLVRNVVAWSALTAGYAELGEGKAALKCFEQMQVEGVFPNAITYISVLKACSSAGLIKRGQDIHIQIVDKGFERDLFVGNTLIDMYAKGGAILDARDVFDKLPVPDVSSWNVMIQGYSMNHDNKSALQLFESMRSLGVKPDAITFACILSACGRANLLLKGQELFKMMREVYGIVPSTDHLNCMVDLLARAGKVCEAEKLLDSSPSSPCLETWRALLSACKKYAEVEIGERCFYQLIRMNPECAAPYVLMRNIYERAARWEDAIKVEELRKLAGAKKKAACASIEVNMKVHEFVVGSKESKEMSSFLSFLGPRAAEEGHVFNLDLVVKPISDEEKEAALCEHVEKLAIAFGLLNTPPGETIRVTKNMRMCNDCHNTSKVISRVEKREIIVRDIYCVHHFKNGLCSCADACIS